MKPMDLVQDGQITGQDKILDFLKKETFLIKKL